jgi:protein-disulfide isomerase
MDTPRPQDVERLRRLDSLLEQLEPPSGLTAADEAALRRAVRSVHRSRRALRLIAAAAGLAVVLGGGWLLKARGGPTEASTQDAQRERSMEVVAAAPRVAPDDDRPAVVAFEGGVATVTREGRWNGGSRFELVSGTALVDAHGAIIRVRGQDVALDGAIIVTTEPLDSVLHVTPLLDNHPRRDDMRSKLEAVRSRAGVLCTAGWILALVVVDGTATIAGAEGPKTLRAGDSWARPSAEPSVVAAAAEPAKVAAGCGADNLDAKGVNAVVEGMSARLRRCFEIGGTADERAAGQLTAVVTVDPSGKVTEATLEQNYSVQNPLIGSCLIGALSSAQFPRTTDAKPATLHLPFVARIAAAAGVRRLDVTLPTSMTKTSVDEDNGRSVVIPVGGSPARGPSNAPVTIVEFTDYECPFCVRVKETIEALDQAYPGKLRWVIKQRPMEFHPRARLAAAAALEAHAQGKFWPYHGLLVEHTNALDRASLERYAAEVALDMPRFRAALDQGLHEATIDLESEQGERAGLNGVPAFAINGRALVGAQPVESFRELIDRELKP